MRTSLKLNRASEPLPPNGRSKVRETRAKVLQDKKRRRTTPTKRTSSSSITDGRTSRFDSRLRDMAIDCADQLRCFGATIEDATAHYIAHRKAIERSCTVEALIKEVLAAKAKACGKWQRPAGVSYLDDLKLRFGRFTKTFGKRTVATITEEEIDDWLQSLTDKRGQLYSPQSRGNYARALSVAFAHAVKRRYAPANPCAEIVKPTSDQKPEILTVEQITTLLQAASRELLPYIAIGAFAGLRAAPIAPCYSGA